LAVAAAVVVLDQLTKVWAVSALSDGPVRVIGSVLEFRLTRNPGGAFSLLTNLTPVLAVLAVVMVGFSRQPDNSPGVFVLSSVLLVKENNDVTPLNAGNVAVRSLQCEENAARRQSGIPAVLRDTVVANEECFQHEKRDNNGESHSM